MGKVIRKSERKNQMEDTKLIRCAICGCESEKKLIKQIDLQGAGILFFCHDCYSYLTENLAKDTEDEIPLIWKIGSFLDCIRERFGCGIDKQIYDKEKTNKVDNNAESNVDLEFKRFAKMMEQGHSTGIEYLQNGKYIPCKKLYFHANKMFTEVWEKNGRYSCENMQIGDFEFEPMAFAETFHVKNKGLTREELVNYLKIIENLDTTKELENKYKSVEIE